MKIPYVIDNVQYRLADVINAILQDQPGQAGQPAAIRMANNFLSLLARTPVP